MADGRFGGWQINSFYTNSGELGGLAYYPAV